MKGKVPNATVTALCGHFKEERLRIQKREISRKLISNYASGRLIEKGSVDAVIVDAPTISTRSFDSSFEKGIHVVGEKAHGRLYETGQRNESGCKRGECFVHHHVQPENQLSFTGRCGQ